MFLSFVRFIAFVTCIGAILGVYLFLTRTYTSTAIWALSQDREAMVLMGADPNPSILSRRWCAGLWLVWLVSGL